MQAPLMRPRASYGDYLRSLAADSSSAVCRRLHLLYLAPRPMSPLGIAESGDMAPIWDSPAPPGLPTKRTQGFIQEAPQVRPVLSFASDSRASYGALPRPSRGCAPQHGWGPRPRDRGTNVGTMPPAFLHVGLPGVPAWPSCAHHH